MSAGCAAARHFVATLTNSASLWPRGPNVNQTSHVGQRAHHPIRSYRTPRSHLDSLGLSRHRLGCDRVRDHRAALIAQPPTRRRRLGVPVRRRLVGTVTRTRARVRCGTFRQLGPLGCWSRPRAVLPVLGSELLAAAVSTTSPELATLEAASGNLPAEVDIWVRVELVPWVHVEAPIGGAADSFFRFLLSIPSRRGLPAGMYERLGSRPAPSPPGHCLEELLAQTLPAGPSLQVDMLRRPRPPRGAGQRFCPLTRGGKGNP